jgi:membrane-anchored glycerophosphoryl diester phosphodiesterase (GDPDase)
MESVIDEKYIRKIPYDIIINNIIPYTYKPISVELMIDIYSYKKDLNMIKNIYAFDFNYGILFNDLMHYINYIIDENYAVNGNDFIMPQCEKILRRNFMISKMNKIKIVTFVNKHLYQQRFETAPRRGATVQTVTGNLVEVSSAERIEIFNGVNISINNETRIERKINYLWGLMTPIERTRFINMFIE